MVRTVEERLKSYEPLWENWTYTGEFLGEGAMSSVFEIQSTAMGMREVAALKIVTVKKNFRGKVEIPKTALNEIKILRTLSGCPNIVHYHDSTQRKIYDKNNELSEIDILIKMEKLKPLSEGDRLSEEQVIKLGKDVCNALVHASEHGIIHRDIKPQNIFVDQDGTYKLGDFGIAKIVSEFSGHYTMNIGTVAYTAPEVYGSTTGTYGISSDVYSLGLVLYAFLNNGCLPFVHSSASLHEAITKRLSGAPFPSPANGSKNLKAIIMRACSNDRVTRYKTPGEMLEDLDLLSTGGKRLVVDPFATLDANMDVIETNFSEGDSGDLWFSRDILSLEKGKTKKGGLRIRMRTTPSKESEGEKEIQETPGKSKLRINMRSNPGKDADIEDKAGAVGKGDGSAAFESGSKLRINMGKGSTPPPESEKKKEEEKSASSFFSTPDSL